MAEMSGNAYIAQILKQEGVEYLMCFPSNPLISEVAKIGIRPVAFRHERGAVMAADGYSRSEPAHNPTSRSTAWIFADAPPVRLCSDEPREVRRGCCAVPGGRGERDGRHGAGLR